jgi:hypothetical protein
LVLGALPEQRLVALKVAIQYLVASQLQAVAMVLAALE